MHANEKLSVLSSITDGLQTNFGLLIGDSPPPHYFLVSHVGTCFPAQGTDEHSSSSYLPHFLPPECPSSRCPVHQIHFQQHLQVV